MKIRSGLRELFFSQEPLTEVDYEKSRWLFIYEGSTAVTIANLTSGAFLAGYLQFMGATDRFNGLVGAIPVLVGFIQIFSSVIFEKLPQRKFLISLLCLIFRLLLGIIFLIPLFVQNPSYRLLALPLLYATAHSLSSFITPAASTWMIDLTPASLRGNYFAKKDAVSLGAVTIVTLAMGRILDFFKVNNNEYGGFLVISLVVVGLAIVNFILLCSIKEPQVKQNTSPIHIKDVFTTPLQSPGFRKVILLFILWNVGLQIAGPFFSVYMVTGLKLDYTYIMAIGVLASLIRVFATPFWGRLADQKSWFFSTKFSIGLLSIVHFLWIFVIPSTARFLIPILQIASGIAWAGIGISLFNIQFLFAKREGRTMYLGLNAAIGGIAGFTSTWIGSRIVGTLEGRAYQIKWLTLGNMQVVFALSGIILFFCTLFVKIYMEKANYPTETE
ncbi:MAG: MFS transporter [Epulopiscium sp.]|nr:MFS transporter [Candidatus Epulonipiscium sp.]